MIDNHIPFSVPSEVGKEREYLTQALATGRLAGDGDFNQCCSSLLRNMTGVAGALITPSCTHALEMAAMLLDLKPGDEIILPSFTFPSTANAFVLRGARLVFVDIRPDTLNIDEAQVEDAIGPRTRAIVPVHYAGVACEMDRLMTIAEHYGLWVVEDAAQGIGASYRGKSLGGIGHFAGLSFHETKNLQCGEGGALLVKDLHFIKRAEIIREKGTNRSQFFRGEVDKYSWVDFGSSQLLGELSAAYLFGQLEQLQQVTTDRLRSWIHYRNRLEWLQESGKLDLPIIPSECDHNGHIFYVKTANQQERDRLLEYLKQQGIGATFHYLPLHSSMAGMRFGKFHGEDIYTTRESERLVRMPIYFNMSTSVLEHICDAIDTFYARGV